MEIEEGEKEKGESISPIGGLVYYTSHYYTIYAN